MARTFRALAAGLVLLGVVPEAKANWFSDTWHECCNVYHRNKMWPKPFDMPDRLAVQAPFDQMVANGWRRQNLLGAHHFTPDNSQLTPVGEQKVQWILTQLPPDKRAIFVERTPDPSINARRVDAVQQLATRLTPAGELPVVEETHIVTEGRPASIVDQTNLQFQQTMPKPQLPAETTIDP